MTHAHRRLKRLVREAFRLSKSELPIGIDLIVLPRRQDASFTAVQQSLIALSRGVARRLNLKPSSAMVENVKGTANGRLRLGNLWRWPGRAVGTCLIGAIHLYQVTLSPLLGPACRFEPSCSRYMVESIRAPDHGKGWAGACAGCRAATRGTPGATTRRNGRLRRPALGFPDRTPGRIPLVGSCSILLSCLKQSSAPSRTNSRVAVMAV